jgi:lipopolysaccharide export system permease protein
MGLGLLTSNNEIIIFRLSGMSKWSIVSSIIKIGVLLGIFVFIGQNFFATKLVSMAHEKKMFYTSQGNAIRMPHGIWIRNNNDYIYIDSIEENKLKNVIRYTFDDNHRLIMGYSASYGLVQDTKLKLNNVKKTTFANEHISSSYLQEDIWNIVIPKHIIMLGTFYPEELTIKQLHDYRNKKQNLGVTGSNYEMLYWNRIFLPLQIIIMMLFAIPIIFSTLRQGKIGFRLLVGIGAGFTFFVINHIIGSLLIIYNITFSWILLLFLLVFLAMWALIYKYP